jgi:hypothetical protein
MLMDKELTPEDTDVSCVSRELEEEDMEDKLDLNCVNDAARREENEKIASVDKGVVLGNNNEKKNCYGFSQLSTGASRSMAMLSMMAGCIRVDTSPSCISFAMKMIILRCS